MDFIVARSEATRKSMVNGKLVTKRSRKRGV